MLSNYVRDVYKMFTVLENLWRHHYKQLFKHVKINRWCGGKFKCHPQTQKKMGTQALQSLRKQGGATPVLVDS